MFLIGGDGYREPAETNYNDGWSDAASCTYSPRHGIAPYCELVNE
jgi:hypothetical protein